MRELGRVILEGVIVAAAGLGIGLGINAFNPKGLKLTNNYFNRDAGPLLTTIAQSRPATELVTTHPATGTSQPAVALTTQPATASPESALAARLQPYGLHVISDADVEADFQNPLRDTGDYVFIDARNDEHYAAAHIPGAYQFDHYYPERYMPEVMPAVLKAQKVIVYCNGGDCEDSEFTAMDLLRSGADPSKVFVYAGGIKEWCEQKRPVEKGARGSNQIVMECPT